jgi:hypothetical protein
MDSPARRGFPGRGGSRWRSAADHAAALRRAGAVWPASDDARAETAARLIRAAGVDVVAGAARAALAPPARPQEALAAFRALATPPRAAKAKAGGLGDGLDEDDAGPPAGPPEISREMILEFLRIDDE